MREGKSMSTNRVLQFLSGPCACCREQRAIERQLDLAAVACERIEIAAGDCIEFWLPSAERYLRPHEEDEAGIRLLIGIETRHATLDEDLARYAVDEMRRIGAALLDAADAVEGGAA